MDNSLFLKVKNIIRNDTGLGEVRIGVGDIYDKLIAAGVEVPELAIAEILERLAKEKLIEVERQGNDAYIITWVSGSL